MKTTFKLFVGLSAFISAAAFAASGLKFASAEPKFLQLSERAYGVPTSVSKTTSGVGTSMTSADINADGFADLISGYSSSNTSGYLLIANGNPDAYAPKTKIDIANLHRGIYPPGFLANGQSIKTPVAPELMVAGDFNGDGDIDIVLAARGDSAIYFLAGASSGFAAAEAIDVSGAVTALAAGEIDLPNARLDLAVAVSNKNTASLRIYRDDIHSTALNYSLPASATQLEIGNLDDSTMGDVAILMGGKMAILHGYNQQQTTPSFSRLENLSLNANNESFSLGHFVWDREGKSEIALLKSDGSVAIAARGVLNTTPNSVAEVRALRIAQRNPKAIIGWQPGGGGAWQVLESKASVVSKSAASHALLVRGKLNTGNSDDLFVLDQNTAGLKLLTREGTELKSYALTSDESPAAALVLPTSSFALPSLIVISKNSSGAQVLPSQSKAVFGVSKTADTNDGTCNSDCSLREAITAANASAGADSITIPAGTYTLTIANLGGNNEDNNAQGDLDINDALTLNGAGAATTIIQAGTTTSNGIDKVLAFNPICASAVNASVNNLTVRFGRNTQPDTAPDFSFTGGGIDVCNTGAGSFGMTNVTVDQNTNVNGYGGGLNLDSLTTATGTYTVTNSIFSANRTNGAINTLNANGGGINVFGDAHNVTISNSTITNNISTNGLGGGAFVRHTFGGAILIQGSSISNNVAAGPGGGLANVNQAASTLTINNDGFVQNNTSQGSGSLQARGGGIYNAADTASSTIINEVTITGNAASTGTFQGGGGVATNSAGPLTLTFNRISGNSAGTAGGSGLHNAAAATTATRNWWGCNAGPGANPCDRSVNLSGTTNATPHLVLTHTASPTSIVVGQTSTLTAHFLSDSAAGAVAVGDLDALIGTTHAFSGATLGTLSSAQTSIQATGNATATFTATGVGSGSANSVVDSHTQSSGTITISKANTTTSITADTPDPSTSGNAVAVSYSVAVTAPGAGTPTGNVTISVSGGSETCTGTVAAGSCNITLTTTGTRNLTATYAGDTNFNGSTSSTESHVVNPANANPTISDILDVTVPVDTATSALAFTVGDVETPAASLTLTAGSSNLTLVPLANIVFGGSGANRTVTVTPATGQTGTSTITVTVTDGGGATANDTFVLTVKPTTAVSSLQRTSGSPTNLAVLTWQVTLANPVSSLTTGNFALVNTGLGGTPTITGISALSPPPSATWNITANTGTGSGTLGLNMANDTGASYLVTNLPFTGQVYTIDRAAPTATIVVADNTLTFGETSLVTITFSEAVTGFTNADLTIPNGTLTGVNSVDGGITFTATFTPTTAINVPSNVIVLNNAGVADLVGNAGVGTTNSNTFSINTINLTPSVTNASTNEDVQTTSGLVITRNPADPSNATHFKITNVQNGSVFLNDGTTAVAGGSFVTFAQGNAGLKFTPAANFSGSATFDVQASTSSSDAGLSGSVVTATISVAPINDIPSFAIGADQIYDAVNANQQTVPNWITAINDGDPDFTQALSFTVTNSNNALFAVQPAVAADGTLTYTPVLGVFGTATLGVTLTDDATAGGPALTTLQQFRTIQIRNPAPAIGYQPNPVDPLGTPQRTVYFFDGVSGAGQPRNSQVSITPSGGIVGSGSVFNALLNNCSITGPDATSFGSLPSINFSFTNPATAQTIPLSCTSGTANRNATLSCTETQGAAAPVVRSWPLNCPSCYLNLTGALDTTATVVNPLLQVTATTGTQTGRLNRFGAATSCAVAYANPGLNSTTGARQFDRYTFTPVITVPTCVTARLVSPNTTLFLAAYNGYNPANPGTNAVADGGASVPGAGALSFIAQPGTAYDFVVHEVNTGGGIGVNYNLQIDSCAVNPNTTPTISDVLAQSTNEDTATSAIPFTVGDTETAPGSLSVTVSSSNTTLVPNANISLGGSGANRTVTITPAANLSGTSTITLTVSDGVLSATDDFLLTVNAVNDPPDAVNDAFSVAEDSSANVLAVLANDSFLPDTGETLSVTSITQPGSGSATLVGGVVSYTPAPNFEGSTTMTYTIGDGNGGSDTAQITLTVTPVNDPPTATNDALSVVENSGATVVNVLANDSFAPDLVDTLTITSVTQPAAGTGSVSLAAGVVSFTPGNNYYGSTSFTYTITDSGNLTATATVNVTITPIPRPTVTTVSTSPNPSLFGQSYTATVQVAGGTGSPTGTVLVSEGSNSCSITLAAATIPNSGGSCVLNATSAGSKTITAAYTSNFVAFQNSSGTSTHQVNPAATTLVINVPAASTPLNEPTNFGFTLAPTAPGGGVPTGTITLTSGTQSCSVNVPGTQACLLQWNSTGNKPLSAVFTSSNGNHQSSSAVGSIFVFARADVRISKDDGVTQYNPTDVLIYRIRVNNFGPDAATGLQLLDTVPNSLINVSWSCTGSSVIACPTGATASGTGNINIALPTLPTGAQLTYTLIGTVQGSPASISNTASIQLPADGSVQTADLNTLSATDTDTIVPPALNVFVNESSITEGNSGTQTLAFTVRQSATTVSAISFDYATANGTASAGSDYVATSGTAIIPAGQLNTTINVTVNGDTVGEGNETLLLNLTNISQAGNSTASGTGTIIDDDLQTTTTTIVSDLPDPSVVGQAYVVSVQVTGQTNSPAGTVAVSDGTASCTATLTAASAPNSTGSCSLTSLSAGPKTLTADFTPSNSAAFQISSATATHQVNPAATTLSITGVPTVGLNGTVTYTIQVTPTAPGGGVPTGNVTVSNGATTVCTLTLPGTNTCPITFNSIGSKTINAVFSASDGNHTTSSGNTTTLVQANVDLRISKSNGVGVYRTGDLLVYTIIVRNFGIDGASDLRILDTVPMSLSNVTWSCSGSSVLFCPTSNGTGNLDVSLPTLPQNAQVTYTLSGTVIGRPLTISNTATIQLPASNTMVNAVTGNLSATDTDILDDLFKNGFEDVIAIQSATTQVPVVGKMLSTSAQASVIYATQDQQGEALRVYGRQFEGKAQIALATRIEGTWTLGAWQSVSSDSRLMIQATFDGRGYALQRADVVR
jgi:CSLREA domain-containing protein